MIPNPFSISFSKLLECSNLFVRFRLNRPSFIVVLGMHRSGTSCATKVLNLAGASFGRTIVDQPAEDNGEIHWESAVTIWINNQVLANSGGSWESPPNDIKIRGIDKWRCRRFLWDFAGTEVGLFKDPRLLLTYKLWESVLPPHVIIACIRHPLEVAKSLEKRDKMPLQTGLALWEHYNKRLLAITGEAKRVYWFNFNNGRHAAKELLTQVSADLPLRITDEALAYFDADSRHHRFSSQIPVRLNNLYETLISRSRAGKNSRELHAN